MSEAARFLLILILLSIEKVVKFLAAGTGLPRRNTTFLASLLVKRGKENNSGQWNVSRNSVCNF